jgi:hypothetical protein
LAVSPPVKVPTRATPVLESAELLRLMDTLEVLEVRAATVRVTLQTPFLGNGREALLDGRRKQ